MRLLVLGANGQLGSDVVEAARHVPTVEAVALTRRELDVERAEVIGDVLGGHAFDVLVNCTSYHRTDDAEAAAQTAVAVNAHAVGAMASICRDKHARLVHVSTDYVFDGRARRPYRETDPPAPLNVYGASKLMGEALIRAIHDDALIFRTASLFGVAGSSGKGGNFVETMIRVGRQRGHLRVINDQFMSPTASADLARWILDAVSRGIPAGTYHAANSGQASWFEFARAILYGANVGADVEPIPASEYPLPASRPAYSVLDNAKLASAIGPLPPWPEALAAYLGAKGHSSRRDAAAAGVGHEASGSQ